jgi:hypothetical protein
MAFDPKRHTMKVQGRDYLPVSARLIWFRMDHPDWGIVTHAVEINLTPENNRPPYAIFTATIFNAEGKIMATATKMEDLRGFGDFLEKSETGAVGRALAYCGYGTQFAPELEEGNRFADAPYSAGTGPQPLRGEVGGGGGGNRFGSGGQNRGGYGPGNGGAGNGGGRPMTAGGTMAGGHVGSSAGPASRPGPVPGPAPRPGVSQTVSDDDPFDDAEAMTAPPRQTQPSAATRPDAPPLPAPPRPVVTRVREPERVDQDPGGPDDDLDDFEASDQPDGEDVPAHGPSAQASTGPAALKAPARPESGTSPLAGNRCSVDGCSNVMTSSQMTITQNRFGRPLCLLHQRDATPLAASSASVGAAPARRGGPAARSGAEEPLL